MLAGSHALMVHLDGMTPTAKEIVQSYRQLYRHGLQAVQYSSPARHTLKDRLRRAYRNGTAADFDAEKIENTIQFLSNAAKEKGMEHRIVKNLLHAWWWERYLRYVNQLRRSRLWGSNFGVAPLSRSQKSLKSVKRPTAISTSLSRPSMTA